MNGDASRFIFSGHAIGASAHFHKLDQTEKLNYDVPVLGASVLPPTGGLSESVVKDYAFEVTHPRRRTLLSVKKIETSAHGRVLGSRYETETVASVESVTVVDKLHIGLIRVHVLAARATLLTAPVSSSSGNRLEDVELGKVKAKITLDDEYLAHCGSADAFSQFIKTRRDDEKAAASYQEKDDGYYFSLVRDIKLSGPEHEIRKIHVTGNVIYWENFGRIYLGEVILRGNDRQVTMVRLQMGSDAGGSGTMGDGQSNGHVGTG